MALTLVKAKEELLATRPTFDQMNLNHLDFNKELEWAIQAFTTNPKLLACEQVTVKNALINIVMTGLTLNPVMKLAYLVPRKGKCCLDISYVGLVKVLTDTGSVKSVKAKTVFSKEPFEIEQGTNGFVKHGICKDGKKGHRIGAYSIGVLNDGSNHIEWMYEEELMAIKKRAQATGGAVWSSDEDEMCRKTVVKRHYKYLPKSERAIMAAQAIAFDDENNGIDFEKEKQQAGNIPGATPDAPFEDAMATDEDYAEMINLISDPSLGEMFHYKPTLKVSAMKAKLEKDRGEGNFLEKSKAEEYIKFLNAEIEFAKAKPADEPMATPEQFEQLYKLLLDGNFEPETINYEFKTQKLTKHGFMKGIKKMQTEGTMTSSKAEQYIKFLENELTLVEDENTKS